MSLVLTEYYKQSFKGIWTHGTRIICPLKVLHQFLLSLLWCLGVIHQSECVQKATTIFTKPNFEHFGYFPDKAPWPQQTSPMAVNPFTVVWPLTSRGRSLICFCYNNRDLLLGFLIMSDFLGNVSVVIFRQNNIMPAQWAFWRLVYYRGDRFHVPAATFWGNRSPGSIKSDSPSGNKYLSAHLWNAGDLRLLCLFCHMKVQMEALRVLGAASVIVGIRWPIKRV